MALVGEEVDEGLTCTRKAPITDPELNFWREKSRGPDRDPSEATQQGGAKSASHQQEEGLMAIHAPTDMHDWIWSWLKDNDREFEKKRKERDQQRERHKNSPHTLPATTEALYEDSVLGDHQRNQLPVGVFLDRIHSEQRGGAKPDAYQLFHCADVGADLFHAAIYAAEDQDNAELFVRAYETWGPLVTAVLEECDLDYRDTVTGQRVSR